MVLESSEARGGLSVGGIVGITIGGVILVAIVVVFIIRSRSKDTQVIPL
jgi:hypothetical protein